MPVNVRDVVVYGASRWDQPWLTEHHLARALSKRLPLVFVDPPQSVLTPLRERGAGGTTRKIRALLEGGVASEQGVSVLRPVMLPPVSSARSRALSRGLIRRQVARAMEREGVHGDLVITTRDLYEGLPSSSSFVTAMVKDWTRAGGHLLGVDEERTRRSQARIWSSADLICATSTRLRARILEEGYPVELLRHGFDASVASSVPDPAAELARLPRPVLGCIGRVDDRWSFRALGALARAFPEGSVVLIGPVNPRVNASNFAELTQEPNVRHFPPVGAAELPAWLAGMDCALIPYTNDEWQRYASPIKIWDYLASGRPIAATGSPAMGEFPDGLVEFAADPERLPDLVRRALPTGTADRAAARRDYALTNTWDDRAAELLALVAQRRGGA